MGQSENDGLQALHLAVKEGNQGEAAALAKQLLSARTDPARVVEEALVPAINEVGELWEEGEYFLPQLMQSAEAMKVAMAVVTPAFLASGRTQTTLGKAVIGTVAGDIHDIGKSLVATMMSASGFTVIDLGADVPLAKFVETAKREDAQLVMMSALLTTTMTGQKVVVEMLREAGLQGKVKVMVGGCPVSQAWATEIQAEGFADNAAQAVRTARQLLGKA